MNNKLYNVKMLPCKKLLAYALLLKFL